VDLVEPIVELYRRMSSDLPEDVERALHAARDREDPSSPAREALDTILQNVRLARQMRRPLCQDTGIPVFYVTRPLAMSEREIREAIFEATREATRAGILRANAVDSLTGKNSGDNVGVGLPIIHIREHDAEVAPADKSLAAQESPTLPPLGGEGQGLPASLYAVASAKEGEGAQRKEKALAVQGAVVIEAMLKGGGCENVGLRYRLPDPSLAASRDLEGVRRCVLAAVHAAQGRACPPYVVGVAVGGARDSTAVLAKRQLFRRLDDVSPVSPLADLEARLLDESNLLGIGPAGLGGNTTVLAVKIAAEHRHPASFFVEVSFGCWAMRRAGAVIAGTRHE
jgi:fumarate hydratase class I